MKNHAYELCVEAGIEPVGGALGLIGFIDDIEQIFKKAVKLIK